MDTNLGSGVTGAQPTGGSTDALRSPPPVSNGRSAEPLVNPLTGEILYPSDRHVLKAAREQLEEWLGHNDVARIPVWKASRRIQEILAREPYRVPARTGQTETQKKLERCPRCSTVLEVEK